MPKSTVPSRNRSPHGWWIGTYIERFERHGEDRSNAKRRCHAYENTVILKAKDRETAYRKLFALGRVASKTTQSGPPGIDARLGVWRFEGITDLLPIYESLEDGAEILWHHHRSVSVQSVKRMVRPKRELPVFDDSGNT